MLKTQLSRQKQDKTRAWMRTDEMKSTPLHSGKKTNASASIHALPLGLSLWLNESHLRPGHAFTMCTLRYQYIRSTSLLHVPPSATHLHHSLSTLNPMAYYSHPNKMDVNGGAEPAFVPEPYENPASFAQGGPYIHPQYTELYDGPVSGYQQPLDGYGVAPQPGPPAEAQDFQHPHNGYDFAAIRSIGRRTHC